ncbi:MAG: hypothetical protein A2Z45_00990 [Chloroflexi bacterium RBG_19FT_COMBO_55_16]|nr:MAG: hypothetical protein A2Z45_00990 [Chloroflexi bacterium RBG_19FT_COMBO_55_16]
MHYVSILSTIVTLFFAVAVFERYRRRKGAHLLLWGIGLVFYGLGTLTEAIMLFTFHPLALKIWYLTGAMLTAAWLGQGTLHLLVRKRGVVTILFALLVVVSVIAVALVLAAPVGPVAYNLNEPASAQYKEILVRSGAITFFTILLNINGTLTLVGGAIYSAYIFWRKHVLADRMIGNILIAVGAMMPAMGGTFIRAGLADWLYLSEFLGAVIMYVGFLRATASQPAMEPQSAAPASVS